MLEVIEIPLELTFPSDWIKMVAMQPHVHLTDTEPFRWPDGEKEKQIDGIKRTLEIAENKQAHFTLFPEYSIPGLDGVGAIDEIIANNDWPNNTIIIGGVDGLSKTEYQQLFQPDNTECHPNNKPDKVPNGYWVNCCVIWIKNDAGSIKKYLQPKISKAKDELLTPCHDLFPGSSVYNFKGMFNSVDGATYEFHFFILLCFDWIYKRQGKLINQLMLEELNKHAQRLEWIFLPQHNHKPNYSEFVGSTINFFDDSICNNVIRYDTAILFINSATDDKPSLYIPDKYGVSSIVFHPRANILSDGCKHTACFKKGKYRNLNNCHDTVFREMGACIHSFEVPVPRFLQRAMGSLSLPIQQAEVYPIIDGEPDPRLPGAEVPACVKWVNDKLDNLLPLSNQIHIDHLRNETETSHNTIVEAIRRLTANEHEKNIHYATASHLSKTSNNEWRNADNWVTEERGALEHMLDTLTMINTACDTELQSCSLHATTLINGTPVEIVAVKGSTHDECFKYYCEYIPPPNNKTFLITKDARGSIITEDSLKKFTVVNPSQSTIIRRGYVIKDYQTVLQAFQRADSVENFGQELARHVG